MSYQYIAFRYNPAPDGEAPQGKVISSAGLPEALAPLLEGVCALKTPAGAGILGPQYSHRRMETAGTVYHIVSSVCDIHDESTGAVGSVAHHLILSEEEVKQDDAKFRHFTPAGLALALDRLEFWCKGANTEDPDADKEPEITTGALPDTETETVWKKLTGDKELAQMLNTPPFAGDCLILLPTPVDARDVLMLLHESDERSDAHGWDHTFTTYGTSADKTAETRRIALPICSALIGEDDWKTLPMLCVNDRLRADATTSTLLNEECSTTVEETRRRVHLETPEPYRYEEMPDSMMFNIPFQRLNALLGGAAVCLLLCLLVCGVFLLQDSPELSAPPLAHSQPPAQPAKAQETKPTATPCKPQKQQSIEIKDVVCHRQALPRDFATLLAADDAIITIQPLNIEKARSKGPLSSIGASENGVFVRVSDRKGHTHMVEISLTKANELLDIRSDGDPAAILITTKRRELMLLPPMYIKLPPVPHSSMPDISVELKPEDLSFEKGALICKKMPDMSATGQVQWETQPTMALPLFAGYKHIISSVPEQGVPFDMMTTPTKKKGDLRQMDIHLIVYNTFRQHFEDDFNNLVNLPVAPTVQEASIAHIFELAEEMKQGEKDAALQEEYENLRGHFLRHIPLPPYRDDADFPREVQEAVCAKLNRDLDQSLDRHREYAEKYDTPLSLELGYVIYNKNSNTLRWIFILHPNRIQDAPQTAP